MIRDVLGVVISQETVLGALAGAVATMLLTLAWVKAKLATPQGQAWAELLARHGQAFFDEVEREAEKLGVKRYGKLALFMEKLNREALAKMGKPLPPEAQAEAAKYVADLAIKAKNS